MNLRKRGLALLMCICMVFTLLPFSVFAENASGGGNLEAGTEPTEPTQTYNFYVGENLYRTQTLKSGDKLLNPGVPAGEGEFLGWYVNADALSFGVKTFSSSATIKVNAMFRGVNFFYFMSSTVDTAVVVATKILYEDDAAITDFSDVVVPLGGDYGVTGWYADKELTTPVTKLSYDAANTAPVPLYPKIEKGFWITFDSNGGTYMLPQFYAGSATKPTNQPTKFGYDFVGWYVDKNLNTEADFATISEPTTVYAKWTPKNDTRYTVVHWLENADDDNYSYKESEYKFGTTDSETEAVANTYEGFTAEEIEQKTIAGDGTTIVNVYYKRNVYEVKFWKDITDESDSIIDHEELTDLCIKAKFGANIADKWPGGSWRISPLRDDGIWQANLKVMPLGGDEFYRGEDNDEVDTTNGTKYYTENLAGDGNDLDHEVFIPGVSIWGNVGITEEDCYEIKGFSFKEYHSISSYYDEANKRDYDEYRGATFYYTRNSYKVAYMNKSKNPVRVDWYKYEADISDAAKFVPDRPYGVPADYIFEGWYSDEACNAKFDFANKTMPYDNITVYANWVPPVCNVEFVAYGETVKTLYDVTYGKDIADKIPTVTLRDGDVLYGWTYDELGTQLFKNDTLITKSYTLYAQIGNKDGYTVTYDANGGTGTAPTDPYHYAINKAAMVLSGSGLIAPLGTVFIGWNTAADGSGTMYYPGSAVPVTDNITLYAMWGDKTGSLEISKTISGNAADKDKDKDKEFTFTVALTNEGKALSGAFGGVEFKDGKASFKLKADESKTFTGLPDGIGYTVTESDNSGYSVSIKIDGADAKAAQGTIALEHKTEVVFNNHKIYSNPGIYTEITVEITGNSDSVVYDGTEHSVKDYTVKISDSRYTEKDFTFSGKALASGVNAGTYEMGLKADQFKNTNARFKNVEFIIKADGVLTITQRPLTITAGSAEGIAPVTCDKYTVEGLATGDKVDSVKLTGAQTTLGESPNVASDAVIKNAKGEDVTANYEITYVDGLLKGIELLEKEIHFNYVIGYTDGTIRPGNNISRAEVATIFFRLLTDEAREQYTTTAGNFTDVKAGMWCNRAIATLTNMGIIKGYTDGTFRPNADITRAELATIIARFAKLDVNTKTFSDINGHWAQKSIELAAGNGWINGYTDGTFRPNKSIIRAETFAMINRVLDRQTESVSDLLPTSEMNMWSDNLNENAWYYKDVQEATNYHKCDRVGDSVYEKWTEKVPDIDWASYQI